MYLKLLVLLLLAVLLLQDLKDQFVVDLGLKCLSVQLVVQVLKLVEMEE